MEPLLLPLVWWMPGEDARRSIRSLFIVSTDRCRRTPKRAAPDSKSVRARRFRARRSSYQAQTHRGKDLFDLVQRLPPEIFRLQHLGFGLLHQFADRLNVGVLQAVIAAH